MKSKMKPWKRKVFVIVYLLLLLIFSEISVRCYWSLSRGVSFFNMNQLLVRGPYEALEPLISRKISKQDDICDVLLLGGSVIHRKYGNVEDLLQEKLSETIGTEVKIHNVAVPAQTSRDSYLKYKLLQDKQFDLVIFYHGINEVRMNNCPENFFDENYNHLYWYRYANLYENHSRIGYSVLPFTIHNFIYRVYNKLNTTNYMPNRPMSEWVEYGANIKTSKTFRKNLESIIEMAQDRQEKLLIMTFAYYIPANYSLELFKNGKLDYAKSAQTKICAIEIWGHPDNVEAAIITHNSISRELANKHSEVRFLDQGNLIPKEGVYFNDICHLSPEGCERFVKNIVAFTEKK